MTDTAKLSELLSAKDIEVLRAAATGRRDTFLPWRGSFGRAARLAKAGLLREAGGSAMPPYVLYVITDSGRRTLSSARNEHG